LKGPGVDPGFESGLINRVRRSWDKPMKELTNEELATFLRQKIAVDHILPIAKERIETNYDDDSELYEGELLAAVKETHAL